MSFPGCMDKHIVVVPFNNKQEQSLDTCNNTDGSLVDDVKWKKPDMEGKILQVQYD